MSAIPVDHAAREVERLLAGHALTDWPDGRLLDQFILQHDESAFMTLLQRHGPMVLRVCLGVLHNNHDAEDAFQATFLVLACNAARIHKQSSLASFLHGTAYRVALRARARELRRRTVEREAAQMRSETLPAELDPVTMDALVHEELARLPERYRQVLVLCHLEGRTHEQAAHALGCPPGSVSRHLHRALGILRDRLAGRGAVPVAGVLLSTVPAALARATVHVVAKHVAGSVLVGGTSVPAVVLAREVLQTMNAFKLTALAALVLLIGLAGGAALLATSHADTQEKLPAPLPAKEEQAALPRVDRLGDPLPPGVLARLGTVRLRQGGQNYALAFSRDGQTLASIGPEFDLRLWQVPSGRELARLPRGTEACAAIAFSADGKSVAVAGRAGTVDVYDFTPGQPQAQRPPTLGKQRLSVKPEEGRPQFLAFLPDNSFLAGTHHGQVYRWDPFGKEVRRLGKLDPNCGPCFAVSMDGARIAIGYGKTDVVIWDIDKGTQLATLSGHHKVSSLAFSSGKLLASGDQANTIRIWNIAARQTTAEIRSDKEPQQLRGEGDAITMLAFTPDGKTLVSVGDYGDGTIRVWDVNSGRERRRLRSQFGDTRHLALSPDGKTLAVTGMSCRIALWDITTGKPLDASLGTQGAVYSVAVSPDSRQVATAGCDGVIRLWDRLSAQELRSFRAHASQIFTLAFSPDGKRLASTGAYDPARLWDLEQGKELRSFSGSTKVVLGVNTLRYSPDGKLLALSANDATLQLVNVATGKIERVLSKDTIDRITFSPDSKLLGGGGFDRKLHVWDVATGKELWSAEHANATAAVAFSSDGQLVVTGTWDSEVIVRETGGGREVSRFKGEGEFLRAMALSPDARLLALSSDKPTVVLHELATGQIVQRLQGHIGAVWSLAFAPDGRSLVSGSFDSTALVWDLTGKELARKQGGSLTGAELEARWSALGAASAENAYQAVLSLANVPKQAVPLLRMRLAGEARPNDRLIARWLEELDAEKFTVRERASRELATLGKNIEADLRRAREATQSLEARRRLDDLLAKLGNREQPDERLRFLRAVAVLELSGTTEALDLLDLLAGKAPTEELRRHARTALQRLAKR
jgi:RNA polymerase sigma factor (sigma-70 family)